MKLQEPLKTVKALVGDNVLESKRCCGESGTLGVTRPDISTQCVFAEGRTVRARRSRPARSGSVGDAGPVKVLTIVSELPAGVESLRQRPEQRPARSRLRFIVEMARRILGEHWLRRLSVESECGWHRAGACLIALALNCVPLTRDCSLHMAGLLNPALHTTALTLHQASRVLEVGFADGSLFPRLPFRLDAHVLRGQAKPGHGPGQEVLQTGKHDVGIDDLDAGPLRRATSLQRWSQHWHIFLGLSVFLGQSTRRAGASMRNA